jgi:predicted Co/Zn/Cd cation transporter (cation efflux family)
MPYLSALARGVTYLRALIVTLLLALFAGAPILSFVGLSNALRAVVDGITQDQIDIWAAVGAAVFTLVSWVGCAVLFERWTKRWSRPSGPWKSRPLISMFLASCLWVGVVHHLNTESYHPRTHWMIVLCAGVLTAYLMCLDMVAQSTRPDNDEQTPVP